MPQTTNQTAVAAASSASRCFVYGWKTCSLSHAFHRSLAHFQWKPQFFGVWASRRGQVSQPELPTCFHRPAVCKSIPRLGIGRMLFSQATRMEGARLRGFPHLSRTPHQAGKCELAACANSAVQQQRSGGLVWVLGLMLPSATEPRVRAFRGG